MVVAALSIILPSIALAIFSRYEITRSVHEQNLLDLGYEENTETGVTLCAAVRVVSQDLARIANIRADIIGTR